MAELLKLLDAEWGKPPSESDCDSDDEQLTLEQRSKWIAERNQRKSLTGVITCEYAGPNGEKIIVTSTRINRVPRISRTLLLARLPPVPPRPASPKASVEFVTANARRLFAKEKARILSLPTTTPKEAALIEPYALTWDYAKNRLGQCQYARQLISLSIKVLLCGLTDDMITETIRHEFAHAATPGAHHGPAWKACMHRFGHRAASTCDRATSALVSAGIRKRFVFFCPVGGPSGRTAIACCVGIADARPAVQHLLPQMQARGVISMLKWQVARQQQQRQQQQQQ